MRPSYNHIHLTAACGTGMGTLACILKEQGFMVSGSDQNVYPPMSDFLAASGIDLFEGFDPVNLDAATGKVPDLVIIGNAVSKENPEAAAVLDRGIPYMSMPQAVNQFIAADKKIILVTGTHGKTTTSSLMSHLLEAAGLSPSFLVGGILKGFDSSFQIGSGEYMVIEGDEYDTAFFDKGPKFMHYPPHVTICTGIEFDHADIFRDLDHICSVFKAFFLKNKGNGQVIACSENPALTKVLTEAGVNAQTYGREGDWQFSDHKVSPGQTRAKISGPGTAFDLESPLPGRHNLLNSLACIAAARQLGIPQAIIQKGMASFAGVKRRQEIRGRVNGITVMDDFAHHPSAVRETIAAVKPFYPGGRVVAVFEPRTNTSMRRFFQEDYPDAFSAADLVVICDPCVKKDIPADQRFSTRQLVLDITANGVTAEHCKAPDQVIDYLVPKLKANDLVLIMSNGGFDNLHTRLLEQIG